MAGLPITHQIARLTDRLLLRRPSTIGHHGDVRAETIDASHARAMAHADGRWAAARSGPAATLDAGGHPGRWRPPHRRDRPRQPACVRRSPCSAWRRRPRLRPGLPSISIPLCSWCQELWEGSGFAAAVFRVPRRLRGRPSGVKGAAHRAWRATAFGRPLTPEPLRPLGQEERAGQGLPPAARGAQSRPGHEEGPGSGRRVRGHRPPGPPGAARAHGLGAAGLRP
jgi:hypothetical protein